jgi:hypothetical protein
MKDSAVWTNSSVLSLYLFIHQVAPTGKKVTLARRSRGGEREGRVLNLSLGGGAIESEVAVSRGEYLKLQIKLPDQATLLEIDLAPVRWVDGKAFGIEFISMQPSAKDTLNRCVAELDELLQKHASQNQ